MAFIGGFTALIGAGLALLNGISKKSPTQPSPNSDTWSWRWELGPDAAIFHLFTHAFFKACLFLGWLGEPCSSSHLRHAQNGWPQKRDAAYLQDVCYLYPCVSRRLSFRGLLVERRNLAWLASRPRKWLSPNAYFRLRVALMTAAYGHAIWYTFHGEFRGHGHPHESPKVMTIPLWILAGMAVLAGASIFLHRSLSQ